MGTHKRFSNVTESYLCKFHEILEEMIQGMTNAKLDESISHNFMVQMIPHHKAAIEMSQNLLQYTTFIPLQDIALNIIDEQTQSIQDMLNILDQCTEVQNVRRALQQYQKNMDRIIQTMFSKMKNARSNNNINQNFMREMIPHHKGAIQMSQNTLRFPICSELRPILKAIIKSQSKGVCKMERLLCRC